MTTSIEKDTTLAAADESDERDCERERRLRRQPERADAPRRQQQAPLRVVCRHLRACADDHLPAGREREPDRALKRAAVEAGGRGTRPPPRAPPARRPGGS